MVIGRDEEFVVTSRLRRQKRCEFRVEEELSGRRRCELGVRMRKKYAA
jgi:hypothetical protein